MEWSWRTVLILLGLLSVAGIMIDGFRRMRQARIDALRFDLDKGGHPDSLYNNPELPKPYRVVGDDDPENNTAEESYFSDFNFTEENHQAPSFSENIEHSEIAEPLESPKTSQLETPVEYSTAIEAETEIEANIEEPEREPVAARPVNLDEDFPVLLDVEELGKEDVIRPQQHFEQTDSLTELEQSFSEKEANPFAELAMNDVEEMEAKKAEALAAEKAESETFEEAAIAFSKDMNAVNVESNAQTTDVQAAEVNVSEPTADTATTENAQLEDPVEAAEPAEEKPIAQLLYPSADAEKLSDRVEAQMALVVHCISRDEKGFAGSDIVNLFNQCDIRFGEKEIFHRFEQAEGKGSIQFSIVHSYEPRSFSPETILEQHFRGLSLFMKLPGAKKPTEAYETMVAIAQLLAKHFNADLFDGERSALTQQTIEHERQQIVDFEYRQKVAAKKQALS